MTLLHFVDIESITLFPQHLFQVHTFGSVHPLLHGASWLKHGCFKISHSAEHLLETASPWHNATLWVRILRNLGNSRHGKTDFYGRLALSVRSLFKY